MYQALYRKYRPLTFDDVVSQPHITVTLQNQISSGKTAHAYLFTGSRGTGKTTCARIFAKAINCENPQNGNPCLECEICKDTENNAVSDIVEIDAASNNGIDDVRELRENALYLPERCKYRIYIIDEVHMLSKEAFNALLKIMEEPPAHVKFILATTEIHKVLPTILSRCQRYDFHRILPEDIKDRLLFVSEQEKIGLDVSAAELIARVADGGMRDALSLLDQCIAFSENVTDEVVANAAGIANREYLLEIASAIVDCDATRATQIIGKLYEGSLDASRLVEDLITTFRNIMVAKAVPENDSSLACMQNEIVKIKELALQMRLEDIFAVLDSLQVTNERISRAGSKRVEIEMCLIKLCNKTAISTNVASADTSELEAKIALLEAKIAEVSVSENARAGANYNSGYKAENVAKTPVAAAPTASTAATSFDITKFVPVRMWAEVIDKFREICPSASGALDSASALEFEDTMLIYTQGDFLLGLLRQKDKAMLLKQAIFSVTGKKYTIRMKKMDSAQLPAGSVEAAQGNDKLSGIIAKANLGGVVTEQA